MKNVPNILSVIRAILAIAVLVLIVVIDPATNKLAFIFAPGLLFLIASLTDMLDGQIARRKNLISDFGKFIDPIADKILTAFAIIGFLFIDADQGGYILLINLAVTFLREFSIASLRMMAAKNGVVIAADWAGKVKTVLQMVAIGGYFFFTATPYLWIAQCLMGAATVMTVLSGALYVKNYFQSAKS